jgi:glycolate oxidase
MGGAVAENAGGPSCLKYGVTKQYILGLEVVLADGRIMHVGALTPKNRTGYELAILFAGSEGTLGIITKICFRLMPAPKATRTLLVAFSDVANSTDTVSAIISNSIIPCRIDFCAGPRWPAFFARKTGLESVTMLLIQVDGLPDTVEIEAKQITEICQKHQAFEIVPAKDAAQEELFWEIRRSAGADAISQGKTVISEDICVPRDKLTKFVLAMRATAQKYEMKLSFGGHAGDGNLHPGVSTDINDPEHYHRAWECVEEIVDIALSMGGVVSGEHGIGLEKRKFYMKAIDPVALEITKLLKDVLDPNHILNPGKIWLEPADVK